MRGLKGQSFRMGRVVGVHAGHKAAARAGQPRVERGGNARVGPVQHAQARFSASKSFQKGGAVIRGAVVYGQHLKRRQRRIRRATLGKEAAQRRVQTRCGIIDRQKHGDQGRLAGHGGFSGVQAREPA